MKVVAVLSFAELVQKPLVSYMREVLQQQRVAEWYEITMNHDSTGLVLMDVTVWRMQDMLGATTT